MVAIHGVPSVFSRESPSLGVLRALSTGPRLASCGPVQAGGRKLVLVHGDVKVLLGLGCSFLIVMIAVVHVDTAERGFVGEHQAIVERIPRVDVVAESDVGQFHRDNGSDGRFVAGHGVDEALADEDGVADGGDLDRSR